MQIWVCYLEQFDEARRGIDLAEADRVDENGWVLGYSFWNPAHALRERFENFPTRFAFCQPERRGDSDSETVGDVVDIDHFEVIFLSPKTWFSDRARFE